MLSDRNPPWLAEVVEVLLRLAARERGWVDAWQLARRLVRRVGEALGYAASSFATARCCVAATAALVDERPTGLHLLLEVAARAAAVSSVPELPASVAALAASNGTSKLAEAARRLSRLV